MLLNDLLCYVIFLITLTTSIVHGEDAKQELDKDSKKHLISKREAVLLFDNFPYEPIYKPRPQKVIYRRVSSPRHNPKPKYGPPRSKYRGSKPPRKPIKKYKKSVPKYGPPSRKRPNNPRYGPPKKSPKPVYGPPKKKHQAYYTPEPASFGEPPLEYYYNNPKQSFGEPPVDFSSQPKPLYDPYQAAQDFIRPTIFDEEASKFGQDFKHWNIDQNDNLDTGYAYSHKQPIFTEQEPSFDPSSPDEDLNAYMDRYKFHDLEEEDNLYERKRKPYYIDSVIANGLRKPQKSRAEEEVMVGGQYAEPPARIVHKSYNMNDSPYSDDDFSPALGYIDPDVAASATISPYVNYKNSNMAFSPQNLNDAFSIVDRK